MNIQRSRISAASPNPETAGSAMANLMLARFAAGVPSLVAPPMADRLRVSLASIAKVGRIAELMSSLASEIDGFWFAANDWRAVYRPYVVRDGVLHIPVKGVLLHDFPWSLGSLATGYLYITRAVERGLEDNNVRGIALVCESPGGEVAGCFEAADKIFAARDLKPIRAFAHEYAYSAAYAIASAASHIAVSRTGGVGSIGVVTSHLDMSRRLESEGLKITFVFAGKHKVDGNAAEPLPDSVRARWQVRIDDLWSVFCAAVARNRRLDDAAVRALEAECFSANEALKSGLADSIAPFEDALAAFDTDLSPAGDDDEGDEFMSDKNSQMGGAAAERARIGAILNAPAAQGRDDLARHFAFDTSMSASEAIKALSKAPHQHAKPSNRFDHAMESDRNQSASSLDAEASQEAARIVAAYGGRQNT